MTTALTEADYSAIELRVLAQYATEYRNPHNGLTPAENERLAWLAEEAAEIGRIIGKIQRFGFESRHPDGGPTNRQDLISEINDLLAVVFFMNWPDLESEFENVDAPQSHKDRKTQYARAQ